MNRLVRAVGLLIFFTTGESWAESFLSLPFQNTARITCDFCCYKFRNGQCHSGIDYGIRNDTEIAAAAAGVVEKVVKHYSSYPNQQAGYGNYVRIRHSNDYQTVYAHLAKDAIYVSEGENVDAGQVLGLSDNSGYSTGPHLHFEVLDPSGRKVNPYGDDPSYPNCGPNALWVVCPPEPYLARDNDGDGYDEGEDCDDNNKEIHPGAREICDGIDNNCASGVDEEPEASASCEDGIACTDNYCHGEAHVCSQFYVHERCEDGDPCTINLCTLNGCRAISKDTDNDGYVDASCGGDDCDDGNLAISPGASEQCNNIDDDCDGETDEDWKTGLASDLGKPCTVGRGECRREGVFICTPDGLGVVCSVDPGQPSQELCDGKDNDCDGEFDEDWQDLGLACGSPPCEGIWYCLPDGSGIYCFTDTGEQDICDGQDNDCDGQTDEPPEADLSCDDSNDCTVDFCLFGVCQNLPRDRDSDGRQDDLCGGDDCNDLDPTIWSYTFSLARLTNAVGDSLSPTLVSTGTELGIAWYDDRDGNREIYFARADSSLTKLGDDVRVTNAPGASINPTLVFDGAQYGLAWDDYRDDSSTDIYFTRLNIAGQEIGDDIKVTNQPYLGSSSSPSIAWTGSEYGLVFSDNRSGSNDIYFSRLDSVGIEIGQEIPLIDFPSSTEFYPSLVFTGSLYGMVWQTSAPGSQQTNFARFTSTGERIGDVTYIGGAISITPVPKFVWQGAEFGVVWPSDTTGNSEIYFARIDANGVKISPDIQLTNTPINSLTPAVAWAGSEYGLTWQENPNSFAVSIYFTRLKEDGSKIGPDFELSNTARGGHLVAVIFTNREYFFAWSDIRDGNCEIYLARLGCNW